MKHYVLALLVLMLVAGGARSQEESADEQGVYLGILFSPIPEALLDHLPQLSRAGGVLVTHILPDSPAAVARLKRHDILLEYEDEKIRDGDHLVRLIRSSREGQLIKLLLVRGGKPMTLPVKLGRGPVLKIARSTTTPPNPATTKPGSPPTVSVTAIPMDRNRLKVTFEFTQSGKLQQITCAGDADDIDQQITRLPKEVQGLARVAIKRLRDLELQKIPANNPSGNRR